MVTAMPDGSRRVIASADAAARTLGLKAGQTIAHAQALVPRLHVVEATPAEDDEALSRLAQWCYRYAPIVAPDPPDGVWIDIAGAAHLRGGEAALLSDLVSRLDANGLTVKAALADTPGAAWAVARYGQELIVAPGCMAAAIAELPVQALRLASETADNLRQLGIERVGQLAGRPRAPLIRRFGSEVVRRLDQALGHEPDPIVPLPPPVIPQTRHAFAEPLSDPGDLKRVVADLAESLCHELEALGQGARRLDLLFGRVDRETQAIRVGTARASRDPGHLARLLCERLGTIDPGFGIEDARLVAWCVEPLRERQMTSRHVENGAAEDVDLGPLVDRYIARFGPERVYRAAPVESEVPERSVRRLDPLAPAARLDWPQKLASPGRLLDPPEPVQVTALLPDYPPAAFTWRGVRRRVTNADGPERINGEWWKSDQELSSARDYYRVEDETGARYWLFRDAPSDEGGRWWLHGIGVR